MKRLLLTSLVLGLACTTVAASSPNWLTAAELYCSPIPRHRHGKACSKPGKRSPRKYKRLGGRK
ncbi:MAG TPA: hypothetical protein VJA19_17560 [Pseudomonas sp.]|nr:hypothetical protein [Pseudomonas sp.]